MLWHGDGTVPFLSAAPHEMADSIGKTFCPENHGTLQRNAQLVSLICDQIEDVQIKRPSFRGGMLGGRDRTALSLRVEDLYLAGEPITIGARVFDGDAELSDESKLDDVLGSLSATFERAEVPSDHTTEPMRRTAEGWRLERPPLPPGIYRVKVEAARRGPFSPLPVRDLFEVVAAG
jgi:hypothetical protein